MADLDALMEGFNTFLTSMDGGNKKPETALQIGALYPERHPRRRAVPLQTTLQAADYRTGDQRTAGAVPLG